VLLQCLAPFHAAYCTFPLSVLVHVCLRLYLEPVCAHTILVLCHQVSTFRLRVVRGREEHALVAFGLLVEAYAAGLCMAISVYPASTVHSFMESYLGFLRIARGGSYDDFGRRRRGCCRAPISFSIFPGIQRNILDCPDPIVAVEVVVFGCLAIEDGELKLPSGRPSLAFPPSALAAPERRDALDGSGARHNNQAPPKVTSLPVHPDTRPFLRPTPLSLNEQLHSYSRLRFWQHVWKQDLVPRGQGPQAYDRRGHRGAYQGSTGQ
jgi:hypothetical protein